MDSLIRECDGNFDGIQVIGVDFYAGNGHAEALHKLFKRCPNVRWVTPKPNVWNGPHKLTKQDWFAAANARNTALCYAKGQWIAYVDDLSVLMPGWLKSVREAMAGAYIVCGAYMKVKELSVLEGNPFRYQEWIGGVDSRWYYAKADPWPCEGKWLFGCSCAMPVEALLSVNGWDENADGLGSEDYCLGIRLQNAGHTFKYDRRMLTLESEEAHFEEVPFKRSDYGMSPQDKSHRILQDALNTKWASNYFGEGGIRALRDRVLAGEPFPIQRIPEHEWFTGIPLSELP